MSRAFINLVVSEDSGHYTIYCFFFYNQYPSISKRKSLIHSYCFFLFLVHIFPIILHAVLAMARYLQEINQVTLKCCINFLLESFINVAITSWYSQVSTLLLLLLSSSSFIIDAV